jgi:hypothetical protein
MTTINDLDRYDWSQAHISPPVPPAHSQLCTQCERDVAEVPWSGERLCWDCADIQLDLMARALLEAAPVQVGGTGWGSVQRLAVTR